jgi:hypothetical protein
MSTHNYTFWQSKGNWYKGNLHTHTTNSDGDLSPEEMVMKYKSNNYNFLSITDHNRLTVCEDISRDNLLLIAGEEIAVSKYDILGININKFIDPKKINDAQGVIDEILKQGGIAIVAHPYFSGLNINDFKPLKDYIGIEVYNTSVQCNLGKGFSLSHWDNLLLAGHHPYGFFTDDSHWHFNEHRPNDTCVSWIMVKAQELTAQSLIEAIKEGNFYSSNGPAIEGVEVKNDKICVKSSPVKIINFIAPAFSGEKFTAIKTSTICEAEYKMKPEDSFVRIECIDLAGNYAVSNPLFFT